MDIYNPDTLQDGVVILLGNQGENDAVELQFDVSAWLAAWPGGAVTISYKRPDDPGVYPVPPTKIQISGNTLIWMISQVVTAYSGHGQAVITYTQGDVIRKSPRVNTYVRPGLPAAGAAPAPIPDYVDEINQLAAGILVTLAEAENEREGAELAKTEAQAAASSVAAISGKVIQMEEDVRRIDWKTGVKKYIIRWNKTTAQCERMGDAAGITTTITNFCHRGSVNPLYSNPFDNLYPWSHRKLCKVDRALYQTLFAASGDITGAIAAWEGEPGFALGGDLADMVYTPTFWRGEWEDASYVYIGVADGEVQGWTKRPATIGGRYHASMDSAGKLTSRAGDIPARAIAMSALHTNAKSQKMTLDDIFTWCDDTVLLAVEYATLNTQAAIGDGVSGVYREDATDLCQIAETAVNRVVLPSAFLAHAIPGAILDIGTTKGGMQVGSRVVVSASDLGGGQCGVVFSGDPISTLTTHFCAIHGMSNTPDAAIGSKSGYLGANGKSIAYYRGRIAHGNFYRYVLGAYRQTGTGKIWTATDRAQANDYDALNTGVHVDTGKVLPQGAGGAETSGYLNALHFVPRLPLAPFGAATGGNSSNPVGDYIYVPAIGTGNTVLLAGAGAINGAGVGRFAGYWHYAASNANWNIAALLFLITPEGD